jgi:hypothetical protein
MKPEVGRRAFVGSVMAGLPLLAGQSGLLAQGHAIAHDHGAIAAADPVIDQIVRQIAMIQNSAQGGPRGAHARALAAQLRMLAVYQRQQGVDDQARAAVRDVVERQGRNAVLYADPDVEMRRSMMKQYGFLPYERGRDIPLNATHAQREAALDALLSGGITPAYDGLAVTLDKVAERLDRRRAGLVTISQDDAWWAGFCGELWAQYQWAQLYAIPFCLTARYFAWAAPSCLALEGGAMVLLIVYLIDCY